MEVREHTSEHMTVHYIEHNNVSDPGKPHQPGKFPQGIIRALGALSEH